VPLVGPSGCAVATPALAWEPAFAASLVAKQRWQIAWWLLLHSSGRDPGAQDLGQLTSVAVGASRRWDSNPRPDDYKSPALPLRHAGVGVRLVAAGAPPVTSKCSKSGARPLA